MEKTPLPQYLENIHVVLCHTSHPSNIGSAARAMKTMGLGKLILVSPDLIPTPMTPEPPVFDPGNPEVFSLPDESYTLSSNAGDVLEGAKFFSSLKDALAPMSVSCAMTSKKREITRELEYPREIAPELISRARMGEKIALVFGNERYGLGINELGACTRLVTIKGNPNYMSLNLSQAVQVMTYELFTHVDEVNMDHLREVRELATQEKVYGLVDHFGAVMRKTGFFEKRNSDRIMRRVKNLFDKAELEDQEIDILRGFLKTVDRRLAPGDANEVDGK